MAIDEKVRSLTNKARVAGALVSLSKLSEGVGQDGVPYCSFSGKINCDPEGKVQVSFRTYEKAKKKNGEDMKNYPKVLAWYKNAIPQESNPDNPTKDNDPNNPTMVEISGSITDNPYVNVEGQLIEGHQYNLKYFSDFKEYKAQMDIEGYVESLVEETIGEDETPTGRMKMTLISRDGFGNTIVMKNLIIPEDFVDSLEDAGWEKGATISAAIDLTPSESVKTVNTAAFGKQHAVQGFVRIEKVVTGGDIAVDPDSERALQRSQVKAMMTERKNKLQEVVDNGYQGSKTTSSVSRGSIGGKKTQTKVDSEFNIDDDDMPF